MTTNEECARIFTEAIKKLAHDENAINNLECYLSHHFDTWLQKFANTPQNMASEMKSFSEMYVLPF